MNSINGEPLLPGEIEELLLRGFIPPGKTIAHGPRKQLAVKIRARCCAVEIALRTGLGTPMRNVAAKIGITERNLHQHFRHKEDLFAFPPPEMATALAMMSIEAKSWLEVRDLTTQLLKDLETNTQGRLLLLRLVELHGREHHLGSSDNHFAHELRQKLSCVPLPFQGRLGDWVGFFTDGFRSSLIEWSQTPDEPLTSAVDRLFTLLGPLIVVHQSGEWAEHALAASVSETEVRQKLEHS
jgi:AcrR family transcriptional regulator